jgi:hypothetical protein
MFDQPSTTDVTEVTVASPSQGEVVDVLPALTSMEDSFCLMVIEYGGNLPRAYRAVYGDVTAPLARARELMARPEVALRIKDLTESVHENALISLGSHLMELAEIRDLGKVTANLKVALAAERARGEVAGFYAGKVGAGSGKTEPPSNPMAIVINVNTPQDASI